MDEELAAVLATALGELGDESTANLLGECLKERRLPEAKVAVCHALGRLGGDQALKWLLLCGQKDRERQVQAAADLALGSFAEPGLERDLSGKTGRLSGDRMSRVFAVHSLAMLLPHLPKDRARKVREDLIDLAEAVCKDRYTAMHAALALGIAGETDANDFFLEYLTPEKRNRLSTESHAAMAMALGLTGDGRAVPLLRQVVGRESFVPDYRGCAAFALGLLEDRESLPLLRTLADDPRTQPELVRSACWALGLRGDESDSERLGGVLGREGPTWHVCRGAAAIALGLIGGEAVAEKLCTLATEAEETSTRAFAIAALGWLIDKDPVPRIPLLFARYDYREEPPLVRDCLSIL